MFKAVYAGALDLEVEVFEQRCAMSRNFETSNKARLFYIGEYFGSLRKTYTHSCGTWLRSTHTREWIFSSVVTVSSSYRYVFHFKLLSRYCPFDNKTNEVIFEDKKISSELLVTLSYPIIND